MFLILMQHKYHDKYTFALNKLKEKISINLMINTNNIVNQILLI